MFSSPAPPSEPLKLNKKVKKVVILQLKLLNYSLEQIGSTPVRRFGVILSGGWGVKEHAIFLSTHDINYIKIDITVA
jgi:hypothetical protein